MNAATPGAPGNVTATAGDAKATVTWTAPTANGGSPITGYTVHAVQDSSKTCTPAPATALGCDVQGLVNGTAYTFTVMASNGTASATSVPSNAVTPQGVQTITFGPLPNQSFGTTVPALTASATSNLPVAFASQTQPVCTVTGTTVTLVAAGTCAIEATQPGNTAWQAATPVLQSFSVTAAAPGAPTNVQATPTPTPTDPGRVTVSWTPPASTGGGSSITYTVTALVSGVPSGQTCTAVTPATSCVVEGLQPGVTYTFAVAADNGSGTPVPAPAPSNPATPLANPKVFSAAASTGTGTVGVPPRPR